MLRPRSDNYAESAIIRHFIRAFYAEPEMIIVNIKCLTPNLMPKARMIAKTVQNWCAWGNYLFFVQIIGCWKLTASTLNFSHYSFPALSYIPRGWAVNGQLPDESDEAQTVKSDPQSPLRAWADPSDNCNVGEITPWYPSCPEKVAQLETGHHLSPGVACRVV